MKFPYTLDNKRYHTLNYYLRNKYQSKVFKISLNAGFSCPNLDGTIGTGGCIYCSKLGSGEYAGSPSDDILKQFEEGKKMMERKWKNSKYIGYFQARTNTYAPLEELKEKYELVLKQDNVVGLHIATRPDSITDEVLEYLEELNKQTDITIELGLQTTNKKTTRLINRCHNLECFDSMVKKLRKINITVVVHIINGLPYETKKDMLNTVKHLSTLDIQGIKIHMLHIIKDTPLAKLYESNPFQVLTKEEYINIVCDQLEILNPKIVIHRITGDPVVENLIAPTWLIKKTILLNDIDKELVKRNSYQGKNYQQKRPFK